MRGACLGPNNQTGSETHRDGLQHQCSWLQQDVMQFGCGIEHCILSLLGLRWERIGGSIFSKRGGRQTFAVQYTLQLCHGVVNRLRQFRYAGGLMVAVGLNAVHVAKWIGDL